MVESALQGLFWLSFLGMLHSYVIYPLVLRWLARNRPVNLLVLQHDDRWPAVSVLMAVHNEEQVLERKLKHLLELEYSGEIRILVGSDCSSDRTNAIGQAFAEEYTNLAFFPFTQRRGKPGVINELATLAFASHPRGDDHILLLTDASVMPDPDCLGHLVKHFANPAIAVVDAAMQHTGMKKSGISGAEDKYISREVWIKQMESRVWQTMIGPFGGCFAIRSSFFQPVPPGYLVDDFYLTMAAFERGGKAINELQAICREGVSHEIREEFRRKVRISAGNFQNLLRFRKLWWPPFSGLQFAFFSHKVLRWLGPFLLLGMLAGAGGMAAAGHPFYSWSLLLLLSGLIVFPMLDLVLQAMRIHLPALRNVRYFLSMNVALLVGFFKYLRGIRSSVWEPTKREAG